MASNSNSNSNLALPSHHSGTSSGIFKSVDGKTVEIRDVWAYNLEEEMEEIRIKLEKYKYISMDTEFPGVVARPVGDYQDLQYQTLRCNVDILKLIQLGITLTDSAGNFLDGCTCWQFNFKFSLSDDIFAQDSIELLKNSGIDFDKLNKFGIDIEYFGELMITSGLVLQDDIKWISFHSRYDFGYLLKTLTGASLPNDENSFLEMLFLYFPCIYDIKYMMTAADGVHGGLSAVGDTLKVNRVGPMHQAGSDSLLTSQVFFSLIQQHFNGECDDARFRGELFGVGTNHTKYKSKFTGSSGTSVTTVPVQFNSSVHYPNNMPAPISGYSFNYEDSYN